MTHKAESCSGLLHCKEQPKKKNAEQNDPGKVDGLEGRGPETGAPSHAADRDLKVGGRSGGGSSPCFRNLVVTHIISLVEPLRSLPEDDSNLATASASLVDRPIAALSSLQVGRSKSKEFVGSNH